MKFTYSDLVTIRDRAIQRFANYPTRHRLDEMQRDLNVDEQRTMAFYESVVEVLNNKGVLDATKLDQIVPHPFTATHEVVAEDSYGVDVTQQK